MPDPAHPHDRSGSEPRTARSPLRLRLVMAAVAAVFFGAGALALLTDAATNGENHAALLVGGLVSAVVAGTAVADFLVVLRRLRRGDTG